MEYNSINPSSYQRNTLMALQKRAVMKGKYLSSIRPIIRAIEGDYRPSIYIGCYRNSFKIIKGTPTLKTEKFSKKIFQHSDVKNLYNFRLRDMGIVLFGSEFIFLH